MLGPVTARIQFRAERFTVEGSPRRRINPGSHTVDAMQPKHRSTARRLAIIAGGVLACVATGLVVLLAGISIYAGSQVGNIWSPGPQSGTVGDTDLRETYERVPLVTESQIAVLHARMPAKDVFRILGRLPHQYLDYYTRINGRWANGHWVRTSIGYDYPIAGTGHLYHGFTVADELEITISQRGRSVIKIARIPWRAVGERRHSRVP